MSQKPMRYALIAGVIFVWGTILYRILAAVGDDETPLPKSTMVKAAFTPVANDSFAILANYTDPFLPDDAIYEADIDLFDSINTAPVISKTTAVTASIVPEKADISFIKFSGLIRNPENKTYRAIISIRGSDYMVKQGETKNEVTIVSIFPERLKIKYKGMQYIIEHSQ